MNGMCKLLYFCGLICALSAFQVNGQSKLDVFYTEVTERFGTYAIELAENTVLPESIQIKYRANGWTYVLANRTDLYDLLEQGIISKLYREPSVGNQALNDSMRTTHFVNQVHQGQDMDFPFTGKNVIMGYVDNGLDVRHLDFKDSLGNTRVLRYWNQGQSVNWRTPTKYGYGRAYKNTDINTNNTIVGNINSSGHGTTVTGAGSANGLANGRNKGVAPDCNIIMVRTVDTLSSWTLTVAEGVDYIFSVADSLGMPAVVNISYGTYLGSHDAKDPAGLYIDSLLNQKEGRILVCAAGNSGDWPAYHVQQQLSADTNFVWMIPNPTLGFGQPGVYFDLWADTNDIQNMHFAFGADAPGPIYRGNTSYKQVDFSNQLEQFETIFGINNDVIGNVIYQGQVVGPNYNLQAIVFTDSLDYHIRFLATGAGKIDLWSSTNLGLSNFNSNIPDTNLYPEFTKYMMPDTLQSIVSSWTCSDQVVTVGNIQNRKEYIDSQGNLYPPGGGLIPSGILVAKSSKGPNRQGNIKPEVVATGDMSLSAAVLFLPHPPSSLDIGGLHIRNGGTSMASPVVAGIAALYLEKCPKATWQDFKNDLINATFQDSFTGNNLPNNAYGFGKAHALNTLLQTEIHPQITGNAVLCSGQTELEVSFPNIDIMVWNTGDTTNALQITQPGVYHGLTTNNRGCKNYTDTLTVTNDTIAPLATSPTGISVSCQNDIPSPDVSLVTNISDDCGIDAVIHLQDAFLSNDCLDYVERTYRVTDENGNHTDLVQTISILQGSIPTTVENDITLEFSHGCGGAFYDVVNCEQKVMVIDTNGNAFDFDATQLIIYHEFTAPLPSGVQTVSTASSGYYEIEDGVNTFRISKKMFTVVAPDTFLVNGGVKVRFYYATDDFSDIISDVPISGSISNFGWFKSEHHSHDFVVGEMSPASPLLASATIINPINSGTEQGVPFVEFLVSSFSTFGFFAATQMTPLPVTLASFTATCGNSIQVNWSSLTELNASHYVVESSRDGFLWEARDTVSAAGTTIQQQHYSTQFTRTLGIKYFRLKQIDLDGTTEVYGPISVNCIEIPMTWFVTPNPSSAIIKLTIENRENLEHPTLYLVDMSGKIVQTFKLDFGQDNDDYLIDVSPFSEGVYTLRLSQTESELIPIKLLIYRD